MIEREKIYFRNNLIFFFKLAKLLTHFEFATKVTVCYNWHGWILENQQRELRIEIFWTFSSCYRGIDRVCNSDLGGGITRWQWTYLDNRYDCLMYI